MSQLFDKYNITKTNGEPIDPNAQYFVLRVDTDPAARAAVLEYARQIQLDDFDFSEQLREWVASNR